MEYLPYILAASVATILTRFLPYWIFKKRSNSEILGYLEKSTTLVIMIILMIYALISMDYERQTLKIYAICCLVLALWLQIWRKNALISMVIPTILYIYLANFTDI